jgi:hypothetical protein
MGKNACGCPGTVLSNSAAAFGGGTVRWFEPSKFMRDVRPCAGVLVLGRLGVDSGPREGEGQDRHDKGGVGASMRLAEVNSRDRQCMMVPQRNRSAIL